MTYTRLFEDFHPGGGPQSVAGKSFAVEQPDFLKEKTMKFFNYKIDSLVQFDERWLYSISFDQKPGVKEALEKGTLLIDADSYAVTRPWRDWAPVSGDPASRPPPARTATNPTPTVPSTSVARATRHQPDEELCAPVQLVPPRDDS